MTVKEIKREGEDNISQGPGTEPFLLGRRGGGCCGEAEQVVEKDE